MNIILLKNFNNYFNRKVIVYEGYEQYTEICENQVVPYTSFNPNDGVETTHIVNVDKDSFEYDYLLIVDTEIVSRWFITEAVRTRAKQYKLTLRRDVIADHFDDVVNAPCYIEKASVSSIDDVAIYNQEDINFNEIKQEEILLKDRSQVPWLVGYYSWGGEKEDKSITVPVVANNIYGSYDTLQDFYDTIGYTSEIRYISDNSKIDLRINFDLNPSFIANNELIVYLNRSYELTESAIGINRWELKNVPTGKKRKLYAQNVANILNLNALSIYNDIITGLYTNSLPSVKDNDVIYISSEDKFYKINWNVVSNIKTTQQQGTETIATTIGNILDESAVDYELHPGRPVPVYYFITYDKYTLNLSEVKNTGSLVSQIPSTANDLQDAPYNMFAIPCGKTYIFDEAPDTYTSIDKLNAISVAQWMQKKISGITIHDVQLLPYCPRFKDLKVTEFVSYPGIDIQQLTEHEDYEFIKLSSEIVGIILFPNISSFTFNINKSLEIENDNPIDVKIALQCDKYRLCSPNMSSVFEFNLVKTGDIQYFNVDCTYKPYSPYIHINPVWSKLYGQDFDDYRGLICQGDFSITSVSEAWTQYQTNNKNYLNAFNKQIETIELGNKIAAKTSMFQAVGGTVSGGMSGAMAGGLAGGPWGAVAGAVIGTGTSAIGGAMDVKYGAQMREQQMANTISQFNYSIDNIKALPQTLSKVSTFDYNNRMFPFIERYSCTELEKEAFRSKLLYDGMTVMRIGTISQFLQDELTFIKGQIIRLDELAEDSHLANEIYNEIAKGVYIQWEQYREQSILL